MCKVANIFNVDRYVSQTGGYPKASMTAVCDIRLRKCRDLPRERAKEINSSFEKVLLILAFERVPLQPRQDYKMRCSHGLPAYRHLWAAILISNGA